MHLKCNHNFLIEMEVNIISQKLIKPSTPTPPNLSTYKISYLDEHIPPMNIGVILYYPQKAEKISQLEESLSEVLPQFYPLAGRYIKKDRFIDCNDEGAEFVRAEAVGVNLSDIVGQSSTFEPLCRLLPRQFYRVDEAIATPLLSVQITGFKCGRVAMTISISHRIFDLSSVATFITAWRNANNPAGETNPIAPSFDGPSLFPWKVNHAYDHSRHTEAAGFPLDFVVKRVVFDKQAIASLRSKLKAHGSGRPISRVRIVSALISKALIGVDKAKRKIPTACLITQSFNIRGRTVPVLPEHSCGNFASSLSTPRIAANAAEDMGVQDFVDLIGEAMEKTSRDCAEMLAPGADRGKIIDELAADFCAKFAGGEVKVMCFSDCTKFGFYEADFGWGKPVWATIGPVPVENTTILMENKEGDGIEAWVQLNQNDVAYFEQDKDIALSAA